MHIVAVAARVIIITKFDLIFVTTGLNWILLSVTQGPLTFFLLFCQLEAESEVHFLLSDFQCCLLCAPDPV